MYGICPSPIIKSSLRAKNRKRSGISWCYIMCPSVTSYHADVWLKNWFSAEIRVVINLFNKKSDKSSLSYRGYSPTSREKLGNDLSFSREISKAVGGVFNLIGY